MSCTHACPVTNWGQALVINVLTSPIQTQGPEAPSSGIALSTSKSGAHTIDRLPVGLLDRCTLFAPLGKGGMAEVFLAAHEVAPHERRPVVIKRLYPHFSDDPSVVQMFMDEARLVCCLDHENIVKTLDVGTIDGHFCLAMEYLAGQPLQRLMRRTWSAGGLSIDLAAYIAIRVLEALEYAHDARDRQGRALDIVHRDITPHNIFVTNSGLVKVLDFGIAKAKSHEGRTAAGLIKGKFAYLAPEQAYGQRVDRRSDLWSMGVVLWEMLSGTRLFRADNEAATLRATLRADIPSVSTFRAEVPPELDQILSRALRRNPNLRYHDATQMKQDLQGYLVSTKQNPGQHTLARLIQELFPEEIAEQRRLANELMAPQNSLLPGNTGVFADTEPTPVTGESAISMEVSHVDDLTDELTKHHQLAFRVILVALFASVAIASFVACYFLGPLSRQPTVSSPHKSAAVPMPVAAAARPVATDGEQLLDEQSTTLELDGLVIGTEPEPAPSVSSSDANSPILPEISRSPASRSSVDVGALPPAALKATKKPFKHKVVQPTRDYGI